jgi:hypothetical protein
MRVGAVHKLAQKELRFNKAFTHLVPHHLECEMMQVCLDACRALLACCGIEGDNFDVKVM